MKYEFISILKRKLNDDNNPNIIFEEAQTGPLEEPILIAYNIDINKFKKYYKKIKKRKP